MAPAKRVFDLSRCIDLHRQSMARYNEKPIAGVTTGLIEAGETVTWKAKHLFKERTLNVAITAMEPYQSFTDSMLQGDFTSLQHEHHFKQVANVTIMIDLFNYEVPFGRAGKMFDRLYLNGYMKKLLIQRNAVIKSYAETDQWKQMLPK